MDDDKGCLYTIFVGFKQHPLEDAGIDVEASFFTGGWIFRWMTVMKFAQVFSHQVARVTLYDLRLHWLPSLKL